MPTRRKKAIRKKVFTVVILLLLILGAWGIIKVANYIGVLYQLFFQKEVRLKESKESRVNILLLGVGGGTHDGPDLTDTIIFTSIDPATKKITLVTIPRDLWVPQLNAKINTAYTFGEEKKKGGGLVLTKAVIGNVLNQQIDYGFKIDFSGFEKAVDMMGGLDITVDNTFDDYAYPLSGKEDDPCGLTTDAIASISASIASGSATELDSFPCRYEHLHFDKGPQHMNGETALKYVRSRHALGPEGSDFARSKRQEKIITAFKEKIFSVDTFLNPVKLANLFNVFKDSIDTDINQNEYADFIKLAKEMQHGKIISLSLDAGDESAVRYGLLDNPLPSEEFGNQWVLTPRVGNGDFSEIQQYLACQLSYKDCTIGKTGILTPIPSVTISSGKDSVIPSKTTK